MLTSMASKVKQRLLEPWAKRKGSKEKKKKENNEVVGELLGLCMSYKVSYWDLIFVGIGFMGSVPFIFVRY